MRFQSSVRTLGALLTVLAVLGVGFLGGEMIGKIFSHEQALPTAQQVACAARERRCRQLLRWATSVPTTQTSLLTLHSAPTLLCLRARHLGSVFDGSFPSPLPLLRELELRQRGRSVFTDDEIVTDDFRRVTAVASAAKPAAPPKPRRVTKDVLSLEDLGEEYGEEEQASGEGASGAGDAGASGESTAEGVDDAADAVDDGGDEYGAEPELGASEGESESAGAYDVPGGNGESYAAEEGGGGEEAYAVRVDGSGAAGDGFVLAQEPDDAYDGISHGGGGAGPEYRRGRVEVVVIGLMQTGAEQVAAYKLSHLRRPLIT